MLAICGRRAKEGNHLICTVSPYFVDFCPPNYTSGNDGSSVANAATGETQWRIPTGHFKEKCCEWVRKNKHVYDVTSTKTSCYIRRAGKEAGTECSLGIRGVAETRLFMLTTSRKTTGVGLLLTTGRGCVLQWQTQVIIMTGVS